MIFAAFIDDLFFTSKVSAEVQETHSTVVYCRSLSEMPPNPAGIIVDLNASTFAPIDVITQLKALTTAPILAFVAHVQVELRNQAERAGADRVVPRSALVQELRKFLAVHQGLGGKGGGVATD